MVSDPLGQAGAEPRIVHVEGYTSEFPPSVFTQRAGTDADKETNGMIEEVSCDHMLCEDDGTEAGAEEDPGNDLLRDQSSHLSFQAGCAGVDSTDGVTTEMDPNLEVSNSSPTRLPSEGYLRALQRVG